ncbi:MAG: hypothetical protein V3R84_05855 [Acidimicrobiia bacterium]
MDVAYPAFGTLFIDGEEYDSDVVIEEDRIRLRHKGPSKRLRAQFGHTPLSADEQIPWSAPRLVIGTGAHGRLPLTADLLEEAEARGVELIALPTSEACELLRTTGDREANAILHVTC